MTSWSEVNDTQMSSFSILPKKAQNYVEITQKYIKYTTEKYTTVVYVKLIITCMYYYYLNK